MNIAIVIFRMTDYLISYTFLNIVYLNILTSSNEIRSHIS